MSGARTLHELVARASARSSATKRSTLISMVERITDINPLDAIESVAQLLQASDEFDSLVQTRMYWTRPADNFALAGIGAAVAFAPEGADRFANIDREWSAILVDAIIDDPSNGTAGTGPLLMGGFAFDPEGPATTEWSDFPAAHVFVPALQLARVNGECWLTTNLLVGADGLCEPDPESLARLRTVVTQRRSLASASNAAEDATSESLLVEDSRDAGAWRATVRDAVAAIRAGRLEKVVLAREVRATASHSLDVVAAIRQLESAHHTSYVFGCWRGDSVFIGATPERLVRVDGRNVQASSLAGSVSRGATPAEDAMHAAQLMESAKDRAEHEIVRRALCAGIERLCDDVTAADGPALLSLHNVHHLHTAVSARLRPGHTLLQLVAQLHPTPAVGGEPRNAALRFIREHEKMDRGWYAAPVGWLQRDRGEFAVALRSALVRGEQALLFAGCGVVADSDPEQEYAESLLKLRPMEVALAAAIAHVEAAPEECGGVSR